MSSNEYLNELLCSLLDIEQSHYVCQPVSLQCGHSICKSCIPLDGNKSIKCKKCQHVTEGSLDTDKECTPIKMLLSMHLAELLVDIKNRILEGIAEIKTTANIHEASIDIKAKYVEEEIEIRVESMKIELDQLEGRLKDELAQIVKQIKQEGQTFFSLKNTSFETMLDELKSDLEENQSKNEERLYYHIENYKCLKQSMRQLEEITQNYEVQFNPSEVKMNKYSVGNLVFTKSKLLSEKIKSKLKASNFETKKLHDRNTMELCLLPNKQFISISIDGLTLYDGNFNFLKAITSIDNQSLKSHGIAVNSKNEIYVSDYLNHRIIKLVMDLNKIKVFGSNSNKFSQLNTPLGICFKKERLFVCDSRNKRIQILSDNLEYVDTMQLDYVPQTISTSATTIGVCGDNKGIYFYDLNTKELKYMYENILGRITAIDSYFYVISYSPSKQLYIFDKNGVVVEEIRLERFDHSIQNYWDGHLLYANDRLFMTCKGQILKF